MKTRKKNANFSCLLSYAFMRIEYKLSSFYDKCILNCFYECSDKHTSNDVPDIFKRAYELNKIKITSIHNTQITEDNDKISDKKIRAWVVRLRLRTNVKKCLIKHSSNWLACLNWSIFEKFSQGKRKRKCCCHIAGCFTQAILLSWDSEIFVTLFHNPLFFLFYYLWTCDIVRHRRLWNA